MSPKFNRSMFNCVYVVDVPVKFATDFVQFVENV